VIHRPVREDIGLPAYYGRCLCNFAEFMAVLYALYSLALALGVKRGHLTGEFRDQQLARIEAAIEAQGAIAARVEPAMMQLAEELGDIDTLWTIGSGPSQGTARYCAAKYHEQMPINGVYCDLEEWAHLEYFLTLNWGARSVVMVIAPTGNSLDRAQEMVQGIGTAGGRAIVVHSNPDAVFPHAHLTVDLGHEIDEWLSPLTFHLPAQLLVLHMAVRAGVPHIPLRRVDGTWLICKGIVRDRVGGLVGADLISSSSVRSRSMMWYRHSRAAGAGRSVAAVCIVWPVPGCGCSPIASDSWPDWVATIRSISKRCCAALRYPTIPWRGLMPSI
jgi:glucosamine--fructose-6-phosphate aminotransferase (isomerizing)